MWVENDIPGLPESRRDVMWVFGSIPTFRPYGTSKNREDRHKLPIFRP